jgi:hypothetical protein
VRGGGRRIDTRMSTSAVVVARDRCLCAGGESGGYPERVPSVGPAGRPVVDRPPHAPSVRGTRPALSPSASQQRKVDRTHVYRPYAAAAPVNLLRPLAILPTRRHLVALTNAQRTRRATSKLLLPGDAGERRRSFRARAAPQLGEPAPSSSRRSVVGNAEAPVTTQSPRIRVGVSVARPVKRSSGRGHQHAGRCPKSSRAAQYVMATGLESGSRSAPRRS